jgi:ribosomal protein S10
MSIAAEKKDDVPTRSLGEIRSITITLSGTDRRAMNKFAKEFHEFVLKFDVTAKEPIIIPTEEAVYTTRKSPCGNGTATFSRHTLRVYQRKFDLSVHDMNITKVVEFLKNSPVDAQLKMNF